jgi:hypothetical protein
MPATMARQGGQLQLEQSDMPLALNMSKMAKQGCKHAAMEERKYLIKKPHVEVPGDNTQGVEFPGHEQGKAVIERHPAMLHQNHVSSCHPCQNGTTKNLKPYWRHTGTSAPPPDRQRQPTPEVTPPLLGMPPAIARIN